MYLIWKFQASYVQGHPFGNHSIEGCFCPDRSSLLKVELCFGAGELLISSPLVAQNQLQQQPQSVWNSLLIFGPKLMKIDYFLSKFMKHINWSIFAKITEITFKNLQKQKSTKIIKKRRFEHHGPGEPHYNQSNKATESYSWMLWSSPARAAPASSKSEFRSNSTLGYWKPSLFHHDVIKSLSTKII